MRPPLTRNPDFLRKVLAGDCEALETYHDLVGPNRRRRERDREEEAILKRMEDVTMTCAEPGRPRSVGLAALQHRRSIEKNGDGADTARLQKHLERLAREVGATVEYASYYRAGYALDNRLVRIPPIASRWSYFVGLHELGHCANPCQRNHVRITTSPGRTACVSCELSAWRWAIAKCLPGTLTRYAWDALTGGLESYRQYATSQQRREIDYLCSTVGFCEARLLKLEKGV